jgi:hypothetical protein
MRIKAFASVLLPLLLALAAAPAAAQSANGIYKFTMSDRFIKYVDFDAAKQKDGTTAGSVFLSDEAPVSYQDVDGTGDRPQTFNGFYIKAAADDIVVKDTQAVISGTITDSSTPELVGMRVLLTVQDNGDNTRVPDQLTWGLYTFQKRTWTASDAELKDDPGVGLRWTATDAERKDDVGIGQPPPEQPAGTQTFPASSYDYADTPDGSGDIVVTP